MVDIVSFRSYVSSGFQKPNRFRVRFPIAPLLQNNPFYQQLYETDRYLEFYCNTFDFVGVNLQTVPITRYGYGSSYEYPVAAMFPNVMGTFYNDARSDNLFYFQQWMAIVHNYVGGYGINNFSDDGRSQAYESYYRDDYAVEASIALINQHGDEVASWVMSDLYPKHIPESKVDWSMNNMPQQITVLFSYKDWYMDVVGADTLVQSILQPTQPNGQPLGQTPILSVRG